MLEIHLPRYRRRRRRLFNFRLYISLTFWIHLCRAFFKIMNAKTSITLNNYVFNLEGRPWATINLNRPTLYWGYVPANGLVESDTKGIVLIVKGGS